MGLNFKLHLVSFFNKLNFINSSNINKGIKCNYEWYGNEYGGFYLCPDFLNNKSIVYSFGIGEDISFDESIINKFKCKVFGFDPTPKSIKWINNNNIPKGFSFYEFGLGKKNEIVKMYLPINPEHVSGSVLLHSNVKSTSSVMVQMKSFKDIIDILEHKQIDILKMDIEGAEYDVIDDILNNHVQINQILIEFHDRLIENGIYKTRKAIRLLKSKGYEIFAISNSFQEISFIKKNIIKKDVKNSPH
jgi:FkbM family methyltransferase